MIPLLLLACGEPISNAALYQDAAFVAALPSEARFGVPSALAEAEAGDAAVLPRSLDAAAALTDLLGPLVASGEAVRGTTPGERSATHRAWTDVTVAGTGEGGVAIWTVDATVALDEDEVLHWTLEVANEERATLATGWQDPSGAGAAHLDLAGAGAIVAASRAETVALSWLPDEVTAEVEGATLLPERWTLHAGVGIGFFDVFEITSDGEAWPGLAVVVHTETGGRAEGVLLRETEELAFGECWDAAGDRVWLGGDGVLDEGDESGCAVVDFHQR